MWDQGLIWSSGCLSPCPTGSILWWPRSFQRLKYTETVLRWLEALAWACRICAACRPSSNEAYVMGGWRLSFAPRLASCNVAHFVMKVVCSMETRQGVVEIVGRCLNVTYWPTEIHKGVNHKPASVHFYGVWMFWCVRKSCEEWSGYLILLSIVFWNVKLVE